MAKQTKRRTGRRLVLVGLLLILAAPAAAWKLGWLEIGPAETGWVIRFGTKGGTEPPTADAPAPSDPFTEDQRSPNGLPAIDPIIFQAQHEPEPEPSQGSELSSSAAAMSSSPLAGDAGDPRRQSGAERRPLFRQSGGPVVPVAAQLEAPPASSPNRPETMAGLGSEPASESRKPDSESAEVPSSVSPAAPVQLTESPITDASAAGPRIADADGTGGDSADASAAPANSAQAPSAAVQIADRSSGGPTKVAVDFDAIDRLIQSGDDIAAHRELSRIYWQRPELRPLIRQRIEGTAQRIFFLPHPHYMEPYVIQPGDQLRKIAKKYKVTWQYLARLNRIDPRRIRAGQKLKVIRGPFSAFIDLSDFQLTVHLHGYYVKSYRVGIGKDGATPTGTFTVLNKVVNPQYTDPDGRVIDADDPANPLGERWIDLGDGYGIHGTIEPDSIGRAVSRGCIRMLNDDVAEVYDFLTVGSEVVIQP